MANITSLQKGLVSHYPLNGVSLAQDITPNALNGTITGATLTTDRLGASNGAYSFNGGSNKIVVPTIGANYTTGFTWSVWVNPITATGQHVLDERVAGSGAQPIYINVDRTIQFFSSFPAMSATTTQAIPVNQWTHISITWTSAGALTIYFNGVSVHSATIATTDYSTKNLYIGARHSDSNWFYGKIADVRRYNRALSAQEIKLLYDTYKPQTSTPSISKGLIAHYPMNGEALAKDYTPNMNNGTITGATLTTGVKGETNGAYNFDGVDDYINVASNITQELTTIGTVSAWFKCTGNLGLTQMIVDKYTSGLVYGFAIFLDNTGKLSFRFAGKSKLISTNYIDNTWHNVVMSSDGTNIKYYVDGALLSTDTSPSVYTFGSRTLSMGHRSQDGTFRFKGSISDVRIYNRALSSTEVKMIYDSFNTKASTSSLNKGLIYDSCLTTKCLGSSTTMKDKTPYGNIGTLVNSPTVGATETVFNSASSQHINLGNVLDVSTGEFTVLAWFKTTGTSQRIISKKADTSLTAGYEMGVNSTGQTYMRVSDGITSQLLSSNVVVNDNNWHLITMSYTLSDNKLRIYTDGILYTGNTPIKTTGNISNSTSVYIGRLATDYFNGSISNVRMWNRALSDNEIKLLFEKGRN